MTSAAAPTAIPVKKSARQRSDRASEQAKVGVADAEHENASAHNKDAARRVGLRHISDTMPGITLEPHFGRAFDTAIRTAHW